MPRRSLLLGTAGLATVAARATHATFYPRQTVRYINLFPPGAATDLLSRAYCATIAHHPAAPCASPAGATADCVHG